MEETNILLTIKDNLEETIQRTTPQGQSYWKKLLEQHPADIAVFLTEIDAASMQALFLDLPQELEFEVFEEFSETFKAQCLSFLPENDQAELLNSLSIDAISDLFDFVSDEELKKYLTLVHKKDRGKVLSLMKFDPESAGGIMDVEVLSLFEDYTVGKCVNIMQRLRPDEQEVYHQIYVTNRHHKLVGHINLEDLVIRAPDERIASFMRKNELVATATDDQETIAKRMVHYNLSTVPVIGDGGYFLGVISSETLADVLVEEASEDVQKMAALAPLKRPYLETPWYNIVLARGGVLVALLLAESVTGLVIDSYRERISMALIAFITMLISTGGNTSNQTSALVIQGISSGELTKSNMHKFLRREFWMASVLAFILGITAFGRAYASTGEIMTSVVVALTLGSIVLFAVILGSGIPLILNKLNIDPAFAAGPILATFMDIFGILIYFFLIRLLLTSGVLSV
jgi:magnesium transporter